MIIISNNYSEYMSVCVCVCVIHINIFIFRYCGQFLKQSFLILEAYQYYLESFQYYPENFQI